MLQAARYLRVSKAEQDPALQDDETAELISKRGWKLVETFDANGKQSPTRPSTHLLQSPNFTILDRALASLRARSSPTITLIRSAISTS